MIIHLTFCDFCCVLYHHNIFIFFSIRQSLVSNFDLGEVKSARLCTRTTTSSQTYRAACSKKGTINFPCAKTRPHTPNMLKVYFIDYLSCNVFSNNFYIIISYSNLPKITWNARHAKFKAEQNAKHGAKNTVSNI